jgi:hypothetical protein
MELREEERNGLDGLCWETPEFRQEGNDENADKVVLTPTAAFSDGAT